MSTRYIPAVSDAELLRIIDSLRKKYALNYVQVHVDSAPISADELDADKLQPIRKANGFAISRVSLMFGKFTIGYYANHGQPTSLVQFDCSYQPTHTSADNEWSFVADATKQFVMIPVGHVQGNNLEALAGFKNIETALAGAVGTFAELQKSHLEQSEQLRQAHLHEIEEVKSRYEIAKQEADAEVGKQKQEIHEFQKKLDDRSNTHARRDIRKEIKNSIAESLQSDSFASNVEKKRTKVRHAFWAALFVLLGLTIYSTWSLTNFVDKDLTTGIWLLGIKASISGISLVGFLLLYLRWETSWLIQRANYESQLASTRVDIDRASWVAESLLEWNRESPGNPIPNELLTSFTRRLFDWDAKVEDSHSASDSLASVILGSAARVQIGPNGANLEIDRKGIKEMSKS